MVPKIIITDGVRWNYFQWFLLGFYELSRKGEIEFEIRLPLFEKKLYWSSHTLPVRIYEGLRRRFYPQYRDSYLLKGEIEFGRNVRKFSIDSADTPYLFDEASLKTDDAYFKMQCPIHLNQDKFYLNNKIFFPWGDFTHTNFQLSLTDIGRRKIIHNFPQYRDKISPLMVGPRRLSRCNDYTSLKKAYENYRKNKTTEKHKIAMCYFGNDQGPIPKETPLDCLDVDSECNIIGVYADQLNHPNEKRAILADILESWGSGYDSRIICRGNADSSKNRREELVIPLKKFCHHIAQFQYNVNVSGYRLSIPNRFIESFMVGTGIVTDKLAVKWYRPFTDEVIEIDKLGYEKMENINWNQIKSELKNLPKSNPEKILEDFDKKWAPIKVAQYIIDTVIKK